MKGTQTSGITEYIQLRRGQSVDDALIRTELLAGDWPEAVVDRELASSSGGTNVGPSAKPRARSAILWILSPFIVLFATTVVSLMFGRLNSPIINIIVILCGMIGVLLLFVGPIVGITKLTKRKR